jgi:hypothetical protein
VRTISFARALRAPGCKAGPAGRQGREIGPFESRFDVRATLFLTAALARKMPANGDGSIGNITTTPPRLGLIGGGTFKGGRAVGCVELSSRWPGVGPSGYDDPGLGQDWPVTSHLAESSAPLAEQQWRRAGTRAGHIEKVMATTFAAPWPARRPDTNAELIERRSRGHVRPVDPCPACQRIHLTDVAAPASNRAELKP